ncbi:MAG: tetraacyldisaccharide 4'-kinase [Tannerella sp.]|jgi:tetraacyldisaccharide 4'-kinase|nr:tetraacyldisaccharide 4'-kinase [Tannerella sp.]
MGRNIQKKRYLLLPFLIFYAIGVRIRNLLFDCGLLSSQQYPIAVICVGNLTVGGSGKTPFVEYLIRLLEKKYRVGVLSRGYKRKTSGYVLADEKSTSAEIGDECCQIKHKYPQITVAVDGNRRRGIHNLMALPEDTRPQVILLDDAFQHRYVQPSLSILITEYNHLYYKDKLLPVGRLREPIGSVRRANIVIVSKCDHLLTSIDSRIIQNEMNLKPHQPPFFCGISYLPFKGVFPEAHNPYKLPELQEDDRILLLTGIATPSLLIEEMKKHTKYIKVMSFADHHAFNKKDVQKIKTELQKIEPGNRLIVCTEKDAARIRNNPHFPEEWRKLMYYVPIEIDFLFNKSKLLDEIILRHIDTIENSKILQR